MKIPENYLPVMPYIIIDDAAAFLDFTKKVFGAAEQLIVPGEGGSIMHGEIKIGGAVLMFANSSENWGSKTSGMFIYVEDADKVYETALESGAASLMQPVKQDYGYSGGFEDPFGNHWWICQGEYL
ncbi:VOC family protein [Flavobacterium sp. RHBU_24]|uniref:VOC family protein n=1 Tax=Flavobacterium sp. RHBU_24 TaxID=3391185 RepID=UPI003984A2B1